MTLTLAALLGGACASTQSPGPASDDQPVPASPKKSRCQELASVVAKYQIKAVQAAELVVTDLIKQSEEDMALLQKEIAARDKAGKLEERKQLKEKLAQVQMLMNRLKLQQNRSAPLPDLLDRAAPGIVRRCVNDLADSEIDCLEKIDLSSVAMPWNGQFEGLKAASGKIASCLKKERFLEVFTPR